MSNTTTTTRSELQFIIGLGIAVGFVILVSFSIIGNPIVQQPIRMDKARYDDFREIANQVESYYSQNQSLPSSLDEIYVYQPDILKDPETGESYEYKTVSSTDYELCTTFSSTGQTLNQNYDYFYGVSPQHQKGYDCVEYSIPTYMLE